jgi:hypothetical protein
MARMVQSNPRANFKVLEGSWRELVEPLRDGEIDMIVGALRPSRSPTFIRCRSMRTGW